MQTLLVEVVLLGIVDVDRNMNDHIWEMAFLFDVTTAKTGI